MAEDFPLAADAAARRRERLRADCARCAGLCCVVPAFSTSADFAIDKPAGTPCPNLSTDFRCGIHDKLRERGFPGCVAYDCFGAGQQVIQVTAGGRDRPAAPWLAPAVVGSFRALRQLHELLWYLTEAQTRPAARPLRDDLDSAYRRIDDLTRLGPEALAALDNDAHWQVAGDLLRRVSELVRAGARSRPIDRRGADLIGARLAGADLKGANLRGARLIGADLTGADMRLADVIGADMRGARLSGADLTGAIFLIQSQLDSATGDAATRIPPSLRRPAHWPAA